MLGASTSLCSQILNERDHSQNLVVNLDKMDLKQIIKMTQCVHWTHTVQCRQQRRALVNTVMNRLVSYLRCILRQSEQSERSVNHIRVLPGLAFTILQFSHTMNCWVSYDAYNKQPLQYVIRSEHKKVDYVENQQRIQLVYTLIL